MFTHVKYELGKSPNKKDFFFNSYYFEEFTLFCNNFSFQIFILSKSHHGENKEQSI